MSFECRTVQKSDLELRFGIAAGLRRLQLLLCEVVDLIEILFVDPVRILVPAGELISPVDKRPDRLAGVALESEASFPGLISDIGQRLGIVAQVAAARNRLTGEGCDSLGKEPVQDVIAQQNGFLARDASHGRFVSVDKILELALAQRIRALIVIWNIRLDEVPE